MIGILHNNTIDDGKLGQTTLRPVTPMVAEIIVRFLKCSHNDYECEW